MISVTPDLINSWADDLRGPVALHLRQKMLPVEGEMAVIFPPTYAEIGYNIDILSDGTKVCAIDSVGAQANRMEPLFKRSPSGRTENPLSALVPQIDIAINEDQSVSILDAGHRLGDALIRASDLADDAKAAFAAWRERGDAGPIAKLAPTSLVFGAWDSRGDQAKLPRIVQSMIQAWDVEPLRRSAQYIPPVSYAQLDVFSDEDRQKAEGNSKSPLSQQGFLHVPIPGSPGGVVARGGIYRDTTVNLVALRQLGGDIGDVLRRYILGLSLVAATEPQDGFLRQGCLLTLDPDATGCWKVIDRSGRRVEIALDAETALNYARMAAEAFGVGADRAVAFSKTRARAGLPGRGAKKAQG